MKHQGIFCNIITLKNKGRRASKFSPLSSGSSALLPDDYLTLAKLNDSLNPRKDFPSAFRCSGSPSQPSSRQPWCRRALLSAGTRLMLLPVLSLKLPCCAWAAACVGSDSPLTENNVYYRGEKNPKPSQVSSPASCLLPLLLGKMLLVPFQ